MFSCRRRVQGLELTTPVLDKSFTFTTSSSGDNSSVSLPLSQVWLLATSLPPLFTKPQQLTPSTSSNGITSQSSHLILVKMVWIFFFFLFFVSFPLPPSNFCCVIDNFNFVRAVVKNFFYFSFLFRLARFFHRIGSLCTTVIHKDSEPIGFWLTYLITGEPRSFFWGAREESNSCWVLVRNGRNLTSTEEKKTVSSCSYCQNITSSNVSWKGGIEKEKKFCTRSLRRRRRKTKNNKKIWSWPLRNVKGIKKKTRPLLVRARAREREGETLKKQKK